MLKRVQNAATNRARIVRNALRRVVLNRTKRARGTMAGNRLNNIVRYYIEKKPVPPVRARLKLPGPATVALQMRAVTAGMKARKNATMKLLDNHINSKNFFKGVPIAKIGTNSVNGAIFTMQMNNGSRKVLKIIHHPLGKSEYNLQKNAARFNISPKVYKLKTGIPFTSAVNFFKSYPPSGKINAFLMNNLQKNAGNRIMSLHDFFGSASNTNKTIIFNKLKTKVKKLSNIGIEHANLHAGNAYVIIKADGTFDVMIIDYGRSKRPGTQTRSFAKGNVGQRFGPITTNYNLDFGTVYQRKKNNLPVILNRNKLAQMKTTYGII